MSEICKKNCGKLIKLAKGPLRGSTRNVIVQNLLSTENIKVVTYKNLDGLKIYRVRTL